MQSATSTVPVSVARILVPVDGSDHSKRAAQVAIELAASYKASVRIISVVSPPSFYIAGPIGAPADLSDYYKLEVEDANNAVASAVELAKRSGLEVTSQVLRPDRSVVESIVEFATSDKSDLIVVGTRGLGGFKKMLLGSVSSGVISSAPCAVLVVR